MLQGDREATREGGLVRTCRRRKGTRLSSHSNKHSQAKAAGWMAEDKRRPRETSLYLEDVSSWMNPARTPIKTSPNTLRLARTQNEGRRQMGDAALMTKWGFVKKLTSSSWTEGGIGRQRWMEAKQTARKSPQPPIAKRLHWWKSMLKKFKPA